MTRATFPTMMILMTVLAGCRTMYSPVAQSGFLNRTVTLNGNAYKYVVYVPQGWNDGTVWPVILFLHGAGERGADGLKQTEVGLGKAIRLNQERFPAIVVFPQAPLETRWLGGEADSAMAALDSATKEFRGDPLRTYLTGLSMGGYGTWHLAMAHPDRFAAIAPVCGGILPPVGKVTSVRQSPLTVGAEDPYASAAQRVAGMPVWIFHGGDDPIIPPDESRRMAAALERLGADVRYTEYPGVGHGSWEPAYAEKDLWNWMLAQHR